MPALSRSTLAGLLAIAGGVALALMARHERASSRSAAITPPRPARVLRWSVIVTLMLLIGAGIATAAGYELKQRRDQWQRAVQLTGGDPGLGPAAMIRHGCRGCHVIPGVAGANGMVGPDLSDVARRLYVGGMLTNTPGHLMAWILDPKRFNPKTAMPATGITPQETRDVAAYLYALPRSR